MVPRLLNTVVSIINTVLVLNCLLTAAEWNVARFGLGPDLVKYAAEPKQSSSEITTQAAERIILPRDADEGPKTPQQPLGSNGGPLPDPTKPADPSLQTIKLPQPGYRPLITTAKTGVPPPVPTEAPPPGEEATTASSSSTIMDMAGKSPQADATVAESTTAASAAEAAAEPTSAPVEVKPEAKGEAAKLGGPKVEAAEATTIAPEAPTEAIEAAATETPVAISAAPEAQTEAAPETPEVETVTEVSATEAPTEAAPEATGAPKAEEESEGGGGEATTAAPAAEETTQAEGGETAVIESPEGAEAVVKALSDAVESKKLLVQNITLVLPNYNPPPQVLFDSILNGRPLQPSMAPYPQQSQVLAGNLRYGPPPQTNLFYADRAGGVGPLSPAYPARAAFDAGGGANRNFYEPCRLFVTPWLGK